VEAPPIPGDMEGHNDAGDNWTGPRRAGAARNATAWSSSRRSCWWWPAS